MKNIINWTLGGFFRSIGRILSFLVIGLIIGLIVAKSGLRLPTWLQPLYVVRADSVSYNYSQYRVQYYELGTGTTVWNSWQNFGTSSPLSSGYGVQSIATRFGFSSKFSANTTYRFEVESGFSPAETINETFINVNSTSCYGSSTSSWSNDATLIDCTFVGAIKVSGVNHVKYIFDVTPITNIYGVQFNIGFTGTSEVRSVNVYAKSSISTGPDITGAIDDQTIVIQEEFENITNTIIQNNTQLIDIINQNNTTCETITISKSTKSIENATLSSNCTRVSSTSAYLTDYIRVNEESTINVLRNSSYCFFDDSKTPIGTKSTYTSGSLTIPQNAAYVRVQFSQSGSYEYTNIKTCMSNTESTNNKLDDINNTLTDTDTDEDSNDLGTFFNDFNLSIEGPISEIVLLPINLLNTLIVDYNSNDTHADLCTTFRGQNICLPSGDIVWKTTGCHDNRPNWFGCPNIQPFKAFLNLTVGGFIIYKLLRRLVGSVEKGLDPQSTRVDLMKL